MESYEWIRTSDEHAIKSGCNQNVMISLKLKNIGNSKRKFTLRLNTDFEQSDSMIEWLIEIDNDYKVSPSDNKEIDINYDLSQNEERNISLRILTPRGGYQNDKIILDVDLSSEDGVYKFHDKYTIELVPVIVIAKCTIGKELDTAVDLSAKAETDLKERLISNKNARNEILSIMSPYEIKGYIFIETMHVDRVEYLARTLRNFKGIISGTVSMDEIEHYLTPKPAVSGLSLGDLVEIVGGPFKGERAKIMSIDASKEEVTVQLTESMVPIPVTVKAESIRPLDSK
ncbi:transcription elongation factor Spt5 [Picrophilus oshimae]|uniref:Transcription elongation factor Spt5 n=1 Tax=Picrophilus torridus (strain ATCC 700027 / DSM 9790 / JCM 10055 / NBRC 100828 / KAW 2/3) TaxID=1122961 RepID=Q6L1X2_PICTO|nr:transcription elongation factor Spt5 [Picrophilus oshimae]AAT43030.1 hypothetical transcription antitermination protein NusG [Picrophilus oshimae DSM 9789]